MENEHMEKVDRINERNQTTQEELKWELEGYKKKAKKLSC